LHFIVVRADSAKEAAEDVTSEIINWGNEDNWRSIGGIASEDGSDDIDHGTFEDDETEMLVSPEGDMEVFFDDVDMKSELDEPKFKGIDLSKSDDIDMDEIEPIQEQINKTLDMFKRFKNY
jgi:hypothetical protein